MLNKTFSALADNNRQKIIDLLKKREMSVSDIVSHLNITMATLSHHLDILKRAGFIRLFFGIILSKPFVCIII